MSYEKGQSIEVRITDTGEQDMCYGTLPDGLGVFVRGMVAVGDLVRAEVFKIKRNYLQARCVEVLSPSPVRISPPCSHFGVCGGCKWQHVSYEEQRRIKHKRVGDALRHLGGFEAVDVEETIGADQPYGYRNKVEFSFADKRYLLNREREEGPEKPENFALGFHAPRQYAKVLDIDHCHIAPPVANDVLHVTRSLCLERGIAPYSTKTHQGELRSLIVRTARDPEQLMVNLVTSTHDADFMAALAERLQERLGARLTTVVNNTTRRRNTSAFGDEEHVVYGPGYLEEKLGDRTFRISANAFFQTNPEQAERLCRLVLEAAEPEPDDVLYDLYAGTGSFSIYLSGHVGRAVGLELSAAAVADAAENAKRNGADRVQFVEGDLKDFKKIAPMLEEVGRPDLILVDPPRAGVHPKALEMLPRMGARRLVYVSCNPASLARDAAALCATGGFRLGRVTPIDMFPQTNHVESVASLVRVE